VLSVDYPLAPEALPAAAVESVTNSYLYLINDLSVHPKKVIIAGESAGGLLTLRLTQTLAERGYPVPAGIWPISAWARHDAETIKYHQTWMGDALLKPNALIENSDVFRHVGQPDELPISHISFSPYHGSFDGFPPMFITFDEEETLGLDGRSIVEKAIGAGVIHKASVHRFGLHMLPVFNCPEAFHEICKAAVWLTQFLE